MKKHTDKENILSFAVLILIYTCYGMINENTFNSENFYLSKLEIKNKENDIYFSYVCMRQYTACINTTSCEHLGTYNH